jgi:MFS family permease
MAAVDATILPIALPTISNALNGSALQAFWLGTSFLTPAGLLQPLYTTISEIVGRKPLLLFAVVLFAGGSVICAVAESMVGMLLGRTIQGIGGGGIYALTNCIVSDIASMQERSRLSNIIGALWAIGGVTGPVIGGVLVQSGHWRWMFWVNVPLCGIAILSMLIFPHFRSDESDKLNKIKKVDWIGCFFLIGSTTSLLVAITWGGIVKPWSAWQTTLPLEFAIGGFIIFLLWSKFSPFECYVPLGRCMSLTSLCAFFGTAVHGMVLWGGLYLLPMYFQAAKSLSPLMTGVSLLPFSCAVGVFAIATTIATSRSPLYRPAIWFGWTLSTSGFALLVLLTKSSSTITWAGLSTVSGIGLGILAPALLYAAQAPATNERVPAAIGLHSFFHCIGRAFGVAIGGTVFQNTLLLNFRQHPDVARSALTFARDAVAFLQSIHTMPGDEGSLKFVLIKAYVDSLRRTWIVMAALAGAAALICVLGIGAVPARPSDDATFSHEMKTFDEER